MKTKYILTILLCGIVEMVSAQSLPGFNVNDLHITRQVINNVEDKTLSELTISNRGKQLLPAQGWRIFFNSRPLDVTGEDRSRVNIKHVNGSLFVLSPLDKFLSIKPGTSAKIQVLSTEIKNKTDLSTGFYLVWDSDPSKGYDIA